MPEKGIPIYKAGIAREGWSVEVGFLDWMKRPNNVPELESGNEAKHCHFTKKGHPINQLSRSDWQSDGTGLLEHRHYLGRSIEGFHGGLEKSYRGGDSQIQWTNARPTAQSAERASWRMQELHESRELDQKRTPTFSERLFAEWDQDSKLAKLRDANGREPELAETAESKSASQPKPIRKAWLKDYDIPF